MIEKFSRRDAIRVGLLAGMSPLMMQAATGQAAEISTAPESSDAASYLTSYLNGGQVLFRWNNTVIAAYRANPIQKYPYFSNLAGPVSGLSLTTESSEPHPHHRGVWLGCEPLCGGDYWRDGGLEEGQIRSIGLSVTKKSSTSAELNNRCQWIRRDAPSPFIDERRIEFTVLNSRVHLIDFDINLTALQNIRISKAKHSFFAIRVSPDLAPIGGGTLMNSAQGIAEAGTFGQPASWCGFYGRRALRPDVVEGVAVMDHPDNPWTPCPWFTRDYGHLSPSPFNFLETPWEIAESKSIRLRYRVVLHAGDPQEAELDRIYKEWVV